MARSQIREVTRPDIGNPSVHQNKKWKTPRMPHADLDFAGVDTQYSMHAVHPYVAAINPPLAAELIKHYTKESDTILDPFCGGGGVVLESVLANRTVTGYDVNPLAVILSRGKTQFVAPATINRTAQGLLDELGKRKQKALKVDEMIAFWYSPEVANELAHLGRLIDEISEPHEKALFRMILSATARDTMFTYRGEVRLRRLRPEDEARFRPDVRKSFLKRSLIAAERIASVGGKRPATIIHSDCREAPEDKMFNCVITSPPYGDDKNGVGYFQFSRNMLYFLGIDGDELKQHRQRFLGCGNSAIASDWNPAHALNVVLKECEAKSPRLHQDAQQFYFDYYQALQKLTRITKDRIIVVTGDRVLARTFIDNGKLTADFLTALGWPLEHYYTREIRKKRIANLGGDGGQISREHVLVHRRG